MRNMCERVGVLECAALAVASLMFFVVESAGAYEARLVCSHALSKALNPRNYCGAVRLGNASLN